MGLGARVRGVELSRGLGRRVRRVGAAGDITAIQVVPLFRISGGDILVMLLYGKVTTVTAGGAPTGLLQITTALATTTTPICTVSADLIGDPADTIYGWTGLLAGVLAPAAAGAAGVGFGYSNYTTPTILVPGVISLNMTAAATSGVVDWIIHYIPLDTDSVVNPL